MDNWGNKGKSVVQRPLTLLFVALRFGLVLIPGLFFYGKRSFDSIWQRSAA
jgi:hypothetical protein